MLTVTLISLLNVSLNVTDVIASFWTAVLAHRKILAWCPAMFRCNAISTNIDAVGHEITRVLSI